tara:strand:+ start:130 stop:426 length:297 start_codon:yes stop_codon:yes gene_type:complete
MKIDKVIEVIRESKRCPIGYKWDKKRKECVPKKSSKWRVYAGWGRYRDEKDDDESKKNGKKGNGNGSNGHSNGNGSGNGNGGNGSDGGNGGGNGGGGE